MKKGTLEPVVGRKHKTKGNYRVQEQPYAVQIELVEGCNLRCTFCGLSGIRGKDNDYKYMDVATLSVLCDEMIRAGWNPRIEFAMHGEPSMHPDPAKMVGVVRAASPGWSIMMTSNGGGLLRKPGPAHHVNALFAAGLNVLALDDYEGANIVGKIRTALEQDRAGGEPFCNVYEYPRDPSGNPHTRRRPGVHDLVFIQDIGKAKQGTHSHLNNHAGSGAPPLEEPLVARCAKPFRELSVRYDGKVAVCCNDWRGLYYCGSVVDDGLEAVWNGPAMGAARQMLYHSNRNFGPCTGCDARSDRVGLLPDKHGREKLPHPNARTAVDVAAALTSRPPLATPVLRPWET
jgi:MoaA/NifB/PqqE/SkfB family radical SAM enzyme